MKKWFKTLDLKNRKIIILALWIATVVLFFSIGIIPSETIISDVLVWVFLAVVVLAILFSVWGAKFKAQSKKEKTNIVTAVNAPIQTVPQNQPSSIPLLSTVIKQKDVKINASASVAINKTSVEQSKPATFAYPEDKTFFFVDVETATRSNDTICAIGAVVVKNGKEQSFYSLINPQEHITNSSIHGISDEDVSNAPTFIEFWGELSSYLGNEYIVVGHNVAFDIAVLAKDLERHGIVFNPVRKVDTMAIAKDILYNFNTHAGDLKLDTLCKKLNVQLNHHNAESDILATKQVLETLLTSGNRTIGEFINMHYSSAIDNVIGNVKIVKAHRYWDDIEAGVTPPYFTNWNKISYDGDPQYDEVDLECLLFASMMDRSDCGVRRVVKQVQLIKEFVEQISGKIYGKGAKSAKCYIEFYYMDVEEYQKLKKLGYKIYHALDVEKFIASHKEMIAEFAAKRKEELEQAAAEKERLQRERDERRALREARKLEPKEPPKKTTRTVIQLNDEGETICVYPSLTEVIKATGINSKSIRDCCNGVQKHAGGFVWKYVDAEDSAE